MKILFLDQSGQLGGAELSLSDVASSFRSTSVVGLFSDGPFRELLSQKHIPNQLLSSRAIAVSKDSGLLQSLKSTTSLIPLVYSVAKLARDYDLIYANTQKALVIGALASAIARRPLVYHLRDILSADHFSNTNRSIAIYLANWFASLVIANSEATALAFREAGGRQDIVQVVYNGFLPDTYRVPTETAAEVRKNLGLDQRFVVGHFSRLSPWKGQHVLLEALASCASDVTAIFVGDALFGEDEYAKALKEQVTALDLTDRVQFLGFRSDIPELMSACDSVVHTSTAPEPFGRVIVEAMLCGSPVIGSAAGGAVELIEEGKTGWLCSPGNSHQLAGLIEQVKEHPERSRQVAEQARQFAHQHFNLQTTNRTIEDLLAQLLV